METIHSKGYVHPFESKRLAKFYLSTDEDKLSSYPLFSFNLWSIILELLKETQKTTNIKVIDIGGGTGRVSREGFKYGFDVYLADILPEMLKKAEEKYREFRGKTFVLDIFDEKTSHQSLTNLATLT